MTGINLHQITIDPIRDPQWEQKKVGVFVLRLDRIHPLISGNKWFKLRYYLEAAKEQGKQHIVTFGGAWSNHLLATAAACRLHDFQCTGIIRGEAAENLTPTLVEARELGMWLHFISRDEYRRRQTPLSLQQESHYVIPEGGYGALGVAGAATILDHCDKNLFTHICCAVGTGTMMAGLVKAAHPSAMVTGISVLKNNIEAGKKIAALLPRDADHFELMHDYHFGGYAKYNPVLTTFMNTYYSNTNIPTDIVYTGKLCYGVNDLVCHDHFPPGSKILVIHSGGLQGNDSLQKGTLIF